MKSIKRKWLRIFIAKYITYLEILAYGFVLVVGVAIFLAWWVKVEDTITSKKGDLVFPETDCKATSDSLVVRILIKDKSDVRKGDVIMEVCGDPVWVARYRAITGFRESLAPFHSYCTTGSVTVQDKTVLQEMETRLAEWDNKGAMAVTEVKAPADGMLWLGTAKEGSVINGGQKLFGVKDLDNLQASLAILSGDVSRCRAGLKARVQIEPAQAFESVIRLNVKPGLFYTYQDFLSDVAVDEIRAAAGKMLLKKPLHPEDEVALPVNAIKGIDIMVEADPIMGDGPTTVTTPDYFRAHKYDAVVTTAKHTGTIKLTKLDPEDEKTIRDLVVAGLKSRTFDAEFGRYHVNGINDMVASITMTGEFVDKEVDLNANPRGFFPEDLPIVPEGNPSEYVFFSFRYFYFTVRLVESDDQMKRFVKELAKQGKAVQVTAEIVEERRRFAMLLFRSD